jgi:uncharacterized protein
MNLEGKCGLKSSESSHLIDLQDMMKIYSVVLRLYFIPVALILLALPALAAAQDGRYPTYAELYVNDFADVIGAADEAAIRERLIELREQQGIAMTVLTVPSFHDYGTDDATLESFATNLFNEWGIGDAERNDGVLLLVAVLDRQVRVELGTGYGREYDGRMQTIIDEVMLPHFRREEYGRGINEGSQAIIATLTGVAAVTPEPTIWQQTAAAWPFLALFSAVALAGGVVIRRRYRGWVGYRCPQCGERMGRLAETAAAALLDAGQQQEKILGSAKHEVWQCPRCLHHRVNRQDVLNSRYRVCPKCHYRTVEVQLTVLQVATTLKEGRKRTRLSCHHCDYQHDEHGPIPRRRTAVTAQAADWGSSSSSDYSSSSFDSSSSSDSGSSFDGGSSVGGGASGDW